MGTLTLSQLKDQVRFHMGNRTDLDSHLTNVLNICQDRIARSHDWEELQFSETYAHSAWSGTPADDQYLLFSNFTNSNPKELYSVVVYDGDSSHTLEWLPPRRFSKMFSKPDETTTHRPAFYTRWNDRLELFRIPDQQYSYRLRGIKWPTTLSADGDTTDLDHKDDMLITLTVSYLFNAIGETDRGARFYAIFSGMWDEAMREEDTEPDADIKPLHANRPSADPTGDYWLNPFVTKVR